jgi:hypothetical protein
LHYFIRVRKPAPGPREAPFPPYLPQTGNVDQESASWAKEADPAFPYGLIRREGGIWRVLQELTRWRSSQGARLTLPA